MVYVALMRLIVVNYQSGVNNPLPDQAGRVNYAEKNQLEGTGFSLTVSVPNLADKDCNPILNCLAGNPLNKVGFTGDQYLGLQSGKSPTHKTQCIDWF